MSDPATAAAIAGGINLAGNIYTAGQMRSQSAKERGFTAYMSNTAYQRGTADLRAAGLNPMLAYTQGGASTPSTHLPDLTNPMEGVASSAMDAMRIKKEIENIEADTKLKNSTAEVNKGVAEKTDAEGTVMQFLKGWFTKGADATTSTAKQVGEKAADTLGSAVGSFKHGVKSGGDTRLPIQLKGKN